MSRHVFLTGPPGNEAAWRQQQEEPGEQGEGRGRGRPAPGSAWLAGDVSPGPGRKRECRVGQYVVDVASFEQLVLPVLRNVSIILNSGGQWRRDFLMNLEQQKPKPKGCEE
uniref:Uncharacterized protein n=1 Tax=Pavo cristatus TaxID=9049 RepID=A0A8C9G614_PAVCR